MRTIDGEGRSLTRFLREATPIYQEPGGIKVRLLRDRADRSHFIEVIEYERAHDYQRDQERIESDPDMIALLERWRSLLSEPIQVEVYDDVTEEIYSEG